MNDNELLSAIQDINRLTLTLDMPLLLEPVFQLGEKMIAITDVKKDKNIRMIPSEYVINLHAKLKSEVERLLVRELL